MTETRVDVLQNQLQKVWKLWLLCCMIFAVIPAVYAQYESEPQSYYLQQHDVQELSFTDQNSVLLGGTWLFYPQHFLREPNSVLRATQANLPISLKDAMGSNHGYGTFVAHFKLPPDMVGRRIGIKIPHQFGAYRIYLNGDFLMRAGEVSAFPSQQVIEKAPKIGYFVATQPYFTLSIQVSNYSQLHGGMENPMRIGTARIINRQYQQQVMSIAAVCGAVLGVSLFTILFSLFRGRKAADSTRQFTFGIFILFLALHNLFSEPYAYTNFTGIEWLLGARLEYLFTYFTIAFFLSYIHMLNSRYLHKYLYYLILALIVCNVAGVVYFEPEQFNRLALYSAVFSLPVLGNFIYGFYQTVKLGEPYSKLNLCAVIFLGLSFLNDFLLMANVLDTVYLSFVSTSLYALLIMFQQSRNYAYYTYHTELLNSRLVDLNNSLDYKVKLRTEELHRLNDKLEYQVQIDALTGAFNRRALNEEIQRLFDLTPENSDNTLIFVMMDVDFFKNYNDHYGHLKGDAILQNLVKVIQSSMPNSAYLARYGGEEFAIVMHNVPITIAEQYMQRVQDAVRQQRFEHANRPDLKGYITLSLGMAYKSRSSSYPDIHELMKAADVELYAAKQAGRDQIKVCKH